VCAEIIFNREWGMPNHSTFQIKPIQKLINRYYNKDKVCLNPFSYTSKYGITNDVNPTLDTDYHLDAYEFLDLWEDESIDLVLYDPPYTTYQLKEHYDEYPESKSLYYTTKCNYWSNQKDVISRIVKPNGIVISFGYDSNGIGKNRGFELIEILLVAHGGCHHDTIITVERKINQTRLI
jgi:hypothetical protein